MTRKTLISVIESPTHLNYSPVYKKQGLEETKVNSMRKAISQLKRSNSDFIVAEFFYGYGNNYAGVNVSNLDVLLSSLPKYAPDAKLIVLVNKRESQYVAKLEALFPLHAVIEHPVSAEKLEEALK